MILTFKDFVSLTGEMTRQTNDGRLWSFVRQGMWQKLRDGKPFAAMQAELNALPATVAPVSIAIATAVTLGSLAWIIHRRNELAGTEDASASFVRDVSEWLKTLFMALLRIKALPAKWRGCRVVGDGGDVGRATSHAMAHDETEDALA